MKIRVTISQNCKTTHHAIKTFLTHFWFPMVPKDFFSPFPPLPPPEWDDSP